MMIRFYPHFYRYQGTIGTNELIAMFIIALAIGAFFFYLYFKKYD